VDDSPRAVEAQPGPVLRFDPAALAAAFGRTTARLQHGLAGSAGFTVEDLAELAGQVATGTMQATRADVPLVTPNGVPTYVDDIAELARDIEAADGRVGMLFLQRIPRYRQVLDACLRQVLDAVGAPEGPMDRDETSVFLAAPHAVVPVHFDSHHNVLLQLAGTKELTIGAFADETDQARALEFGCRSRKRMADVVPPTTAVFHLEPGDGLYIPPYTFHWVTGGPEPSAALSCSFSTAPTERAQVVHACNAQLRRLGLHPRPPGRSIRRDRLKAAAFGTALRVRTGRR
jgi:hypothetical protein